MLGHATARASAINDGAERRLGLLTSAHTETMRQLKAIRDARTSVVSADRARGPLADEVARTAAATLAAASADPAREVPAGRETGPDLPDRDRVAAASQPADPSPTLQKAGFLE